MNQTIERVNFQFRVRWQKWKSGVEEGEKVGGMSWDGRRVGL